MKVSILSITAGQGHNATAKAVGDALKEYGIQSEILDTFSYLNKAFGDFVSKGYLLAVDLAKGPYALTYRLLENRKKSSGPLSPTRTGNLLIAKKLKTYLDDYKPDVIVCTHIFSAILIDVIREEYGIDAKTIGILTDFTVHPYWEEALTLDKVVTACDSLTHRMMKKGYREDQILPIGIPIHPKFNVSVPKEEARAAAGLDSGKATLLLMGGSMGYGSIGDTIRELDGIDTDFQIIAVCGNNREAKEKIDAMKTKKKIVSFGFTDKVDLLMDASDAIITKPGGLTTSESLAKRLPMIIINPIPGQEDRNTEFLLNSGVAMAASKTLPLEELVYTLFHEKKRIELMRNAIEAIRHPDSTQKLCEYIRACGKAPTRSSD